MEENWGRKIAPKSAGKYRPQMLIFFSLHPRHIEIHTSEF